VLESLRKTTCGVEGQGIYWVTAVEHSGHL
jgi:hypothetical protein